VEREGGREGERQEKRRERRGNSEMGKGSKRIIISDRCLLGEGEIRGAAGKEQLG